ncbi:MAG: hypothetical protein Q9M94_03450 [Candidatus Gracilibacteria bacterium]|nr:hypothetical protein [Candidatus Gracilibacteria bacterium]
MKNKIRKTIIILIIIILSFQIFQKFEFLFFQIQVCNETDKEIRVYIEGDRESYLNDILNFTILDKIFSNYKIPFKGRNSLDFSLKKYKCSGFFKTNPFTKGYTINVKIIESGEKEPIRCYSYFNYDMPISSNVSYGEHVFIIKKFKFLENGLCRFYYTKK